MAPSLPLLCILFTVGFLAKRSISVSPLELGIEFIDEPKDVVGVKGKSVSLLCKARAARQKEALEVVWYHNEKLMELRNEKRRSILQNGTLYFSKVIHKKAGHSDQGEYRCVVIGQNGSLSSRPGFLRITSLPENFSLHPNAQAVEIGSNVRFSCEIESLPELEIEWEKNNRKVINNSRKHATISGPGTRGSILYIFKVEPEDSGSYRCVAKNALLNKQRHSSEGILTVLPKIKTFNPYPLTFLSAQPSLFFTNLKEIKEGDDVALDCVTNGYPLPKLGWAFTRNGKSQSQIISNATTTGYNIIRIKNVTRNQGGRYTCSPTNSPTQKLTIQINVMIAPEIREKSDNILFLTSKTVRFRCIAYGNPIPEIYWLKDGSLFNITGRIKHWPSVNESEQFRLSELVVSSTVAKDAGIYQCMAKNAIGWSWAASRLRLNDSKPAPRAPEKVSCEPISSSQIKLNWEVPSTSKGIIAFTVHYETEQGEEREKVVESNYTSTHIDKLLPFSNYTFKVRLYSGSASDFSEATMCQTEEEVPIEAPKKLLKIISPNSVQVSWIPLSKEKARGHINQYKIQWRLLRSPSSKVDEVDGNVLNYTITGLVPGKKYEVRVLGATSKGLPESDLPWELFEIPEKLNINIPSPPEVRLLALNSSSIEIMWNLTSNGVKILGFKIFYRKQNGNQIGPLIVSADTNKYILGGLESKTWYEIMVQAFTKNNEGGTGLSSIHTLSNIDFLNKINSSFPEPPLSLEADPVSPVAINLSWSKPQPSPASSIIDHYTVCFNPVKTVRNRNTVNDCIISSDNKILIVGLNPYTLYEFKVKSHDLDNKQSAFSQVIECHTLEDVPGEVEDITWKAINKTSIQVFWKKPEEINGVLKNYILFYTKDSSLPLNLWKMKNVSASDYGTKLTDLASNVKYYLVIRASTNAGLGSYGSPQQLIIRSPIIVKNKQSNHYLGIMLGLGIGLSCIILCTTCILCRRKCLKRQVSQEFEASNNRRRFGNECLRNGELVTESRETEYFTFFSSRKEQASAFEIAIQEKNCKSHYLNGSSNGVKTSLLSEGWISNDSSGKTNVCITENPRYIQNSSDSPLLSPKACSSSSCCGSVPNSPNLNGDYSAEWKSPLLTSKRKLSEGKVFLKSNNNDSELETYVNKKKISTFSKFEMSTQNKKKCDDSPGESEKTFQSETDSFQKLNEDDQWAGVNSVLRNPDFRFSNSIDLDDIVSKKCGYLCQSHLYNDVNENNDNKDKYQQTYDLYKNSKLPLHLVSKEITQES